MLFGLSVFITLALVIAIPLKDSGPIVYLLLIFAASISWMLSQCIHKNESLDRNNNPEPKEKNDIRDLTFSRNKLTKNTTDNNLKAKEHANIRDLIFSSKKSINNITNTLQHQNNSNKKNPTNIKKVVSEKKVASDSSNINWKIQKFIDDIYDDGHTEEAWNDIGLKVSNEYISRYRKRYTYTEVEPSEHSQKYLHLTMKQRRVKILGDALVKKTGSKIIAKNILVSYYRFSEDTAKYAVGYAGYYDW